MAVLIAVLGGLSHHVDAEGYFSLHRYSRRQRDLDATTAFRRTRCPARITTVFERALTTTVNDIEHIESSSYNGVSVIRIFFQPNVKIDLAIAQVVAVTPADPAHPAARHFSARRDQVRRVERADSAAQPQQQDSERAGTVRSRRELHPHPARHHSGRDHSAALWRQAAPDHGGYRSRTRCTRTGFPPPMSPTRSTPRT